MKKILGLDLGTNSIGWAVTQLDFDKKVGEIKGMGSRIIPMSQDILGNFESGNSVSQTADRTKYRGVRRLYQRDNLRRERLHRVLNILGFLPEHYKSNIHWENGKNKGKGQFKKEVKLNYRKNEEGKHEFIFMDSFGEMAEEFKQAGNNTKIPYDWTLYYLRKKALTKKIMLEELSWLLLNFNQKRGYYQLRGDELDKDNENKNEKYYALKVIDVKATDDKNSKGVWYEVILENNRIYKRQSKEPLDSWIGTVKEFIITEKINKKGEKNESYRVPKEDDWGLIKKKTEQDLDNYISQDTNHTVGTYIYETMLQNPNQKIRGKLIKTIERKYYKEELEKILETQISLHKELQDDDLYKSAIEELYPYNEAHRNNINDKGFKNLFLEDIIFYQRPLKSKKSTIGGCQYETHSYRKTIIDEETGEEKKVFVKDEPLKAISKSHPMFQEFRLWQFLKNLKILKKEAVIDGKTEINADFTDKFLKTEEDWTDLFDFLNNRKEVEQKDILNFLVEQKLISRKEKDAYRWNNPEDKKYPASDTLAQILLRLKKVSGDNNLSDKQIIQLWHIIYSVKDKNQYETALGTFARKNNLDEDEFIKSFMKFPPFKNDYGAYSEKAIKKLLPLMRRGKYWNEADIPEKIKSRIEEYMQRVNEIKVDKDNEDFNKQLQNVSDDDIPKQLIKSFIPFKGKNPLTALNTYQACYAVYERHSEVSEITRWKSPKDIDKYLKNFKQHCLRNPIVEQVVTETLRTVRDIWKEYGDFNEIHVELGREIKNPAEKRKTISKRNTENENTNYRIKKLLEELMNDGVPEVKSYSPSHQEILKIYEDGIVSSSDNLPDDIEQIRKKSSPDTSDIIRYKLWLEQGYISPYTSEIIRLSELFTEKYQIEHIIPQSRYFDNSFNNKVICESEVNEVKSNQTAYEFIKNNGGAVIGGYTIMKLDIYEAHCKKYFKNNRAKLKNLLSEDIPEGFINRQINDTRYISKLIKGLLSNIVREEGEQEATSKNIVTMPGAITSQLKKDWGLNDAWNDIIAPRFKRLNELTGTNNYGCLDYQKDKNGKNTGKQFFRLQVPEEIQKGFNKKRIDHRHHALDAMVIATCTRKHIQYINSLNNENEKFELQPSLMIKNKEGHYTKHFQLPWQSFPVDAKNSLEKIIVSFKQNLRVINKATNKYQKYVKQKNGGYKKQLVKQKGTNWAIRKSLHTPLPYGKKDYDFSILEISKNVGKKEFIIDDEIRTKVEELFIQFGTIEATQKEIKKNPIVDNDEQEIKFCAFKVYGKRYRKRQPIVQLANRGQGGIKTVKNAIDFINKVSDLGIRNDLLQHLKDNDYDLDKAFAIEGIEKFNSKRKIPVYRLPIAEPSTKKFPLGNKEDTKVKYGEADAGTNLFFAIYETTNKKGKTERTYETIPLNEVIAHQKWRAEQPKEEQEQIPMVPVKNEKGKLLFTLSPNDLVYVPSDEEMENPNLVDFNNLSKEQISRIYVVNDFSSTIYFTPNHLAKNIAPKEVDLHIDNKGKLKGSFDTKTASLNGIQIKDVCWKLKVNRLGDITGYEK